MRCGQVEEELYVEICAVQVGVFRAEIERGVLEIREQSWICGERLINDGGSVSFDAEPKRIAR